MEILFLISDHKQKPFYIGDYNHKKRLMECAAKTGSKVIITSWHHLHSQDNQVLVKKGIIKQGKEEKQIKVPIKIAPDYINLHINNHDEPVTVYESNLDTINYLLKNQIIESSALNEESITKKYLGHLIKNFWKKAKISYHSEIVKMGKWYLEKYLKEAEKHEIKVNRPFTIIKAKDEMIKEIEKIFGQKKDSFLIIKPHHQTCGRGIKLISAKTKDKKIQEILNEKEEFYILQEFLTDTHHYEKRKTDLRIYVGIFSWSPLKFKVYPYGLTRIANDEFDIEKFENENSSITTMSLLRERLKHNITIEEYFDSIHHIKPKMLWENIEKEIEKTLQGIIRGGNLNPENLKNVIYLLGFDIILKGNNCQPYILEINHFPTLYRGKENDPEDKVNSKLDQSYTEFFEDIIKHCRI